MKEEGAFLKSFCETPHVVFLQPLFLDRLSIHFPSIHAHCVCEPHFFSVFHKHEMNESELWFALFLRNSTTDERKTFFEKTKQYFEKKQESIEKFIDALQYFRADHHVNTLRFSEFEKTFLGESGKKLESLFSMLKKKTVVDAIQKRKNQIKNVWETSNPKHIPEFLSGSDLINLGMKQGKTLRDILNHVRDLQLEGKILNRTSALQFVKQLSTKLD